MGQRISDKELYELFKKSKTLSELSKKTKISRSTLRYRIKKIETLLTEPPINPNVSNQIKHSITSNDKRYARYVITSAQNATPVFKPFFLSLLRYCKVGNAQLMVIPYRYKNPTSVWNENNLTEEWWDKSLTPYLCNERIELPDVNLTIMGDVKTQPTAVKPLSGCEVFTNSNSSSAIFGYPKLQLKTVATPKHQLPKILATTGSVTEQNYTDSKAGKKGEVSHTYSAQVIEVDRKTGVFHIRQIIAEENGKFVDLDKKFSWKRVVSAPPALALAAGDTHALFADKAVIDATYLRQDSMTKLLRVKHLIWNDVLDFYSRNHHERGNFLSMFAKHHSGFGSVESEVDITFALMDECTPDGVTNVVVKSNHDEALDRWVKETDFKSDPENALFYLETALVMLGGMDYSEGIPRSPDPLAYWAEKKLKCFNRTKFLKRDESFSLLNTEYSNHGDIGANGARGTIQAFTKAGGEYVIGHSHSPGIEDNVLQTGLSAIYNMNYAKGMSSWLHSHAMQYYNGKKTLLNVINGEWRIPWEIEN